MPLAPSSHASFIARVGNPAGRQQTEAGAASSPRATLVRTYVRARARRDGVQPAPWTAGCWHRACSLLYKTWSSSYTAEKSLSEIRCH